MTAEIDSTAADAAVSRKLIQLEDALDHGEIYADRWWIGWLATFGGAAVGAGGLSFVLGSYEQPVLRIGALRSSIGVASVLFVPFPASDGPAGLRALPEKTPAERIAKLRAAEKTLRRAAEYERLGRSWFAHLGSFAVNAAFSIWVWRGYHQPLAAAISLGTGVFASESKIWTQPTQAIEDEAELLDAPSEVSDSREANQHDFAIHESAARDDDFAAALASRISVAPLPGGLALGVSF